MLKKRCKRLLSNFCFTYKSQCLFFSITQLLFYETKNIEKTYLLTVLCITFRPHCRKQCSARSEKANCPLRAGAGVANQMASVPIVDHWVELNAHITAAGHICFRFEDGAVLLILLLLMQ